MENIITPKKANINIPLSLDLKPLVVSVLMVVQVILEIIRPVSYVDEIIGVIAIIMLIYYFLKRKISPYDEKTVIILGFVVLIGLLANYIYGINSSMFSISVDVLTQIKVIIAFFSLRYFLTDRERQKTINYLTPVAELFVMMAFFFAIINLFFNMNSGGEKRYGLNIFKFIFGFVSDYTACAILFFSIIVCSTLINTKTKRILLTMGMFAILCALKSAALSFCLVYICLMFYFKRYERITLRVLIPMIALGILVGSYQIQTYLMDTTSPRRVFFDYAVIDARDHFPLGSGFGTFGSAEAAKNYSSLYYQYGFDHMWGLSPDRKTYLHDNYWQSLIGQFGWIGFALFLIVYGRVLKTTINQDTFPERKALQYAMFFSMMVFAIGFASISSSPGLVVFMALSLCSTPEEKKQKRRLRIRINY